MDIKVISGKNSNVWKYVFSDYQYIVEAVLYRYKTFKERTVICCSVQSGCPVGCVFCGTGRKFIKNLSSEEIIFQIKYILTDKKIPVDEIKRFQIMFMSMGEPMLNWDSVEEAIRKLHQLYPSAELLISTIGLKNQKILKRIINVSKEINKIGIQFSIHDYTDEKRDRLIPYRYKLSLDEISRYGQNWYLATGRHPYLNYIVTPENSSKLATLKLRQKFDPKVFYFTLSVLCEINKQKQLRIKEKIELINKLYQKLLSLGFNLRIFNPAGQDDIGGGCGQLWFVQEKLKNMRAKND